VNQQDQQNNLPRSARAETKRLKKIIIITFCVLVALVVVYYLFTAVLYEPLYNALVGYFPWLENILDDGVGNEYQGGEFSIYFYPIDYDLNILKYDKYLDLDRNVYYYKNSDQSGSVVVLDEKNCGKQAPGVTLLYEYVESIIMGDVDTYNACYSDFYFENKGLEPDPGFTMTQLYEIKITNMGQRNVSDQYGTYTQYDYVLEYKIHENNSTFRSDIPSDSSAAQYIVITDRNGELLIENLIFPYFFPH